MANRKPMIAVVGDAKLESGSVKDILAEEIGRGIIDAGYRLVTGGLGGVMEAAHRGARQSPNWHEGCSIAILPGSDPGKANPYADIVIPTGLDHVRNTIVAQASAVIAIGGGAGTLSEIAFAWMHKRLIIALACEGWSGRLADTRLDDRIRYETIRDDRIYGAQTAADAFTHLSSLLPLYDGHHRRIG